MAPKLKAAALPKALTASTSPAPKSRARSSLPARTSSLSATKGRYQKAGPASLSPTPTKLRAETTVGGGGYAVPHRLVGSASSREGDAPYCCTCGYTCGTKSAWEKHLKFVGCTSGIDNNVQDTPLRLPGAARISSQTITEIFQDDFAAGIQVEGVSAAAGAIDTDGTASNVDAKAVDDSEVLIRIILVLLAGSEHVVEVRPADSLDTLKGVVHAMLGLGQRPEELALVMNGSPLEDGTATLASMGVFDGSRILLVLQGLGDMQALRINLSDYTIVRRYGSWGLGDPGYMILGRKNIDGKLYAIKAFSKGETIEHGRLHYANSERDILGRIAHEFIVNMTGYSQDDHHIHIVMENVIGCALHTYRQHVGRFDNAHATFYAAQVTIAITYLHSKGVVHRDVTLQNVFLCSNGYCKLTNFGIAKVLRSGDLTFTQCGNPAYMPPEVLNKAGHGKPRDWWALGILIYEMVVGNQPFQGSNVLEIFKSIYSGRIFFPALSQDAPWRNCKKLLKRLLTPHLIVKPGYRPRFEASEVIKCEWFNDVDFDALEHQRVHAPSTPSEDANDTLESHTFPMFPLLEQPPWPPSTPQGNEHFLDW